MAAARARRVVLAAGGTGGHFYPGLALAQTLRERGWQPLFLIRSADEAAAALEREGIAAVELPLRGLPRRLSTALPRFFSGLWRATRLARRVLTDFDADVVVGMGGYLTFPAVAAAARLGLPRALHESNAVLGLANRVSRRLGAALFWGLPPAHGKGRVTGTPIRQALWDRAPAASARRELGLSPNLATLLVFGGSQGARGLNAGAPAVLGRLARRSPRSFQVLHLAGRSESAEVERRYRELPVKTKVLPFLERMELAYAAGDLALCRSGASTLAELSAQRLPAILVPFPSAAGNHQEANARVLERCGACRVVLERDLDEGLEPVLSEILTNGTTERLAAMSEGYAGLGLPPPRRCAQELADAVEALAR
ncbi:MAG: UDP-N-acetylglucosamine--N-acetylmuramyl-(pentapeptide) pyrophosphoryl-undecaprenol N-acetylglucosamine transferase [Elusimicrobia bacterium]|nr:UDP-N-acetylglucosamine--N-acetylmuramyl-(pentapeptide) pyrophosphoryl-undecaprenol N-acetylglucosamine transferase [Elusimicrobiota bacterium]MDE2425519.1 UDP-N-acetylglucosamine--N-acetylmuramyl-(pentapeptide) pyrophosphoryl-undecaprenol N-acetylglucosamine transferase [Elusimicrobiota bacterium]